MLSVNAKSSQKYFSLHAKLSLYHGEKSNHASPFVLETIEYAYKKALAENRKKRKQLFLVVSSPLMERYLVCKIIMSNCLPSYQVLFYVTKKTFHS